MGILNDTEAVLSIEDGKMYEAEIVTDSVSPVGVRLVTMKWTIWRPILAEVNTHRMMSKNAPSSRALSVTTLLKRIEKAPALPVWWGKRDGAGMVAEEELGADEKAQAQALWEEARQFNIATARKLSDIGLHQQVANRIVESWMATTIIITGTSWKNLFRQRVHAFAQPEFHRVAASAERAMKASIPTLVPKGGWSLPFVKPEEWNMFYGNDMTLQKISSARCARASYFQYDGSYDIDKDLALHDRLYSAEPPHSSPFEHPARCMNDLAWYGNLRGWEQYRKQVPGEYVEDELYVGETKPYIGTR